MSGRLGNHPGIDYGGHLDVKGFNQSQDEILVIDTNLNNEIDPKDEFIAVQLEGYKNGQKVPFDHPRFLQLRERYAAFLISVAEDKK